MKTSILKSTLLAMLTFASGQAAAQVGGKFYGLWWDGAAEHLVSVDPASGAHTSIAVVPDVKLVEATFRIFDPDSSRFAFIGGPTGNSLSYHVLDVGTVAVIATAPRTDNLKNPSYDPGAGLVYGTWWSDSTPMIQDSMGHPIPQPHEGTEYFSAINPVTGARTDVPIPGVNSVAASGHFLDTDSGRYVFHAIDTAGIHSYYVIDVATGSVLAQIPMSIRLDFPVYNPVMKAVHGLWWSDSTVREFDSLGRPEPVMPHQIKGAEYFVTVFSDSTITFTELPGVRYISNFNRALDTDSGRYVFTGQEATGPGRYYVVDVATGSILSNTEAAGMVKHIVYAPVASSFFPTALQPPPRDLATAWALRRAADGATTLSFANPAAVPHAFSLHDVSGKTVLSLSGIRADQVRLETAGMKAGLYVFRLRNARGLAAAGKLIVE